MRKLLSLALLVCAISAQGSFDSIGNTINGKTLIDTGQQGFSFLTAGHVYGDPSSSYYPSPSLIWNLDKVNGAGVDFMVLLGDNVRQLDSLNVSTFKSSFLDRVDVPVFNAVGNHDLFPGELRDTLDYAGYRKYFGAESYYAFVHQSSLFIVLDTERHRVEGESDGSIRGEQLEFLRRTLNDHSKKQLKNVFICMHSEINLMEGNNYRDEVLPLFAALEREGVHFYVLSGDLGRRSQDLYIKRDHEPSVTYVHTSLTEGKEDKILRFEVSGDGGVKIQPISLLGPGGGSIEEFPFVAPEIEEYREPSVLEKLGFRLGHKFFYEGIILGLLGLVVFLIAKRKWKGA